MIVLCNAHQVPEMGHTGLSSMGRKNGSDQRRHIPRHLTITIPGYRADITGDSMCYK